MTKVSIPLKKVGVGPKIWVEAVLDPDAYVNPVSSVGKKIQLERPVYKQHIVLINDTTTLTTVFTATFGDSTTLPDDISNITDWYPAHPAEAHGEYDPLVRPSNTPEWICLSAVYEITQDPVLVLDDATYNQDAVDTILATLRENGVKV